MSKIAVNHNATLVSQKGAVVIRGDDGSIVALTPALARALAASLPRFTDAAERIIEPMPEAPRISLPLILHRDTPIH